ncbi:MAG: UDP-N-acetylmuramoyl-L-alanyl-D-glutamate--2,6-diaminopimelate ligase [Candidatus Omnitrophota bacterium]|jgi:UDP-N-acetylmuramoyl-L-alanyl-D-glutamate--2,6-diaminopimelate ligase
MKLSSLILGTGVLRIDGGPDCDIGGVCADSRYAVPGDIFIAVRGRGADGHKFIPEAVSKGARAVAAEDRLALERLPAGVALLISEDSRAAAGRLAAGFYGLPSSRLKVAGITGTNGKTTLTYLLEHIISFSGGKAGVIGTVNYRLGGEVLPSSNTTPGAVELQKLLSMMERKGASYAVMEVSSHALDQRRTEGVDFHSAVFTNLTRDHLDYHKTEEEYFKAKALLFSGLSVKAFCVINTDDNYGRRLAGMTAAAVNSYGLSEKADFRACDINLSLNESSFRLAIKGADCGERFRSGLVGSHNVYNALAAAVWALNSGIGIKTLRSALESFSYVPGRLERIDSPGGFSVYVDYAHTPDALEKVLSSLKQLSAGRIITVFGCGGERDRLKRPLMGAVVSEFSDYVLITNDNPRSEEPVSIISEIEQGMKNDNYRVVPDRREAIAGALKMAARGDIVLVAGKGHEDYQIIGRDKLHFDDREVVRECLR